MVEIASVFVGLIFVAAVTGLILVNDFGNSDSIQIVNSGISTPPVENELVRTLNDMDTKLVSFFYELKEELLLINNQI